MIPPVPLIRAACAITAAAGLLLGGAAAATSSDEAGSAREDTCGQGVSRNHISIQLYTFAEYVGFGDDAATLERLNIVLAELADIGYRNVEPYTFNGLTAEEYADLLDSYGLHATSRHGSTQEAEWETELAAAKTLGQEYIGSGGEFFLGSYQEVLDTGSRLDRLSRESLRNGTGKAFVHNHQREFEMNFADPATGVTKTAWEHLLDTTRYVTFQLDVLWAFDAGVDVPALIEKHGSRIDLLHIKDGVEVDGEQVQTALGEGDLDLPAILESSRGTVRYYVVEQDPVFFGEVDDMLDEARISFEYLDCFTY